MTFLSLFEQFEFLIAQFISLFEQFEFLIAQFIAAPTALVESFLGFEV